MTSVYAKETSVSAEKSRAEIERILSRYGATAFGYGWNRDDALVTFEAHGRRIRFVVKMPSREDPVFTRGRYGRRTELQIDKLWEQAQRQRWRALALVVKAKLEAVQVGLADFEEEFLPYTLVPGPDGRAITVAELMLPQVAEAYAAGAIPGGLLLALPAGDQSG